MTTTTALILIVVIAIVAIVAWALYRRERARKLRARFGPEFERAALQYGGPARAAANLEARQKRMEKVKIHSLSESERGQFASQWHDVQLRFVDNPTGSIDEADHLVKEVMLARGYPMTDFERRAEDISVDHPHVVSNYRTAHDIALASKNGKATTEDLRRAVVCYRQLFEELLEMHVAHGR